MILTRFYRQYGITPGKYLLMSENRNGIINYTMQIQGNRKALKSLDPRALKC